MSLPAGSCGCRDDIPCCVWDTLQTPWMEDYRSFLADNFVEAPDGMFTPRDPSHNHYRHFGLRRDGRLWLTSDDVLYLYSSSAREEYSVRTKAYFLIRNSSHNLLPTEGGGLLLYRRTKNFNRNKERPVCPLVYVCRDSEAESVRGMGPSGVCCVVSDGTFTFLKVRRMEELDFEICDKLRKGTG